VTGMWNVLTAFYLTSHNTKNRFKNLHPYIVTWQYTLFLFAFSCRLLSWPEYLVQLWNFVYTERHRLRPNWSPLTGFEFRVFAD